MAVLIFFNKMRWDSNVSLDLFDFSNRNIILKKMDRNKTFHTEGGRGEERKGEREGGMGEREESKR